jgi:NusA-like KH domain protein
MIKQTLDMRFIRYLNLFEKITKVRPKHCFFYNNYVVFSVSSVFISKAVGRDGKNVKKLASILNKKIKIISPPKSVGGTEKFISEIIKPSRFKTLEVSQSEIIITADRHTKAVLMGRNKTRLQELKKITQEFFGKDLRIV